MPIEASKPRVFTLPAGAPFLPTLARALVSGELIENFPSPDPLDLARATIYLPTQRAAAAFARELVAASGAKSLILPRIAPLGAFEPLTPPETTEETPGLAERPAVGDLARRMVLAELALAWGRALKGAIRRVDADGRLVVDPSEPPLVAASPPQAFALASDLAALIDDMIIDDVAPEKLENLVADAFDPYWRITLDFLKIAFDAWPRWLDEKNLVDGATLTAERVDQEVLALAAGGRGPVIIAGSTGANRATARLIAAIARAREGAVVVPQLDQDLDDDAFASLGRPEEEAGPVAGHPQALLSRLLGFIGIARRGVRTLGEPPAALRSRAKVLSEALRPAETTALWPKRREELGAAAIAEGFAGVSLIVAETESEEALALAVAMREVLETPGRTAALITPDATLARRVAAELARWGIEVENSAGRSLGETRAGALARLALAAACDFSPGPVAALLAHPDVALGRADIFRDARALELGVLRVMLPPSGLDDIDTALAAGREAARDVHAHRAMRSLSDADFRAARRLLADLAAALAPLRAAPGEAALTRRIEAHRAALAALAAPGDLTATAEGLALDDMFDEWALAAGQSFAVTLADYRQLFEAEVARRRAPAPSGAHPRLAILGLLEARLLSFDLVLTGGLDETVWPPAAETDAFLNRTMRASLGLSAPERRIGQTAHDFSAALGAPEAIVSRAKKRLGAPTVASRFLQRLGAVAGEAEMAAMQRRGERWLGYARALDHGETRERLARPEPKPAVELRPTKLSVTRIETLRRDPYAIFAERILDLTPLSPIGAAAGAREVGLIWHAVLEEFSRSAPPGEPAEDAEPRLIAVAERLFAPLLADPAFRALSWPRIAMGLERFLAFDAERRAEALALYFERDGALEIAVPGAPPFTLTARADRIETLPNGGAALVDYKTGSPPGDKEVAVGFAPQLTLEAAMLARGAFADVGAREAEALIYFKLGGADGGDARAVKPPKESSLKAVIESHYAGLQELIAQFSDPETPYLSQPYPKFLGRGADYDHLARVKEWAATGDGGEE